METSRLLLPTLSVKEHSPNTPPCSVPLKICFAAHPSGDAVQGNEHHRINKKAGWHRSTVATRLSKRILRKTRGFPAPPRGGCGSSILHPAREFRRHVLYEPRSSDFTPGRL